MNKMSPDEKITAIALEQPDPFAREGQLNTPLNKTPFQQRDFSHLDDPSEVKKTKKAEIKEKKKQKAKGKVLEVLDAPEPIAEPVPEPFPNDTIEYSLPEPADLVTESRQDSMPSYRAEFGGRDLMVGFPCYKTTNPVTAFAMIAMALDFGRDKIRFDMSIGDSMVYHSRNRLAEKFLQTDARYLLMIDDDIIPCIGRPAWMRSTVQSAQNVIDLPLQRHIIHRLLNSGKTLIGGAYFGRQEGADLMCSDQNLAASAKRYDDIISPVNWVGTGCLLVHRSVFNDIKRKYPELATANPDAPFDYFLPMAGHIGEDVAFCQRAREAGHMPHIDLGTPVFHVGFKTY
jgi:hypothetical protein